MSKSKETGNVFFNQISSICLGKNISEIYNENAEVLISHPFNKLRGHCEKSARRHCTLSVIFGS